MKHFEATMDPLGALRRIYLTNLFSVMYQLLRYQKYKTVSVLQGLKIYLNRQDFLKKGKKDTIG